MADDVERDDALFVNLVMIFQGAAMQQMGKVINPLTGKVEKNLEQARYSIDTLAMLREKTRGNLSGDLERLVDSALLSLRMNYVEEAAAEQPSDRPGEGEPGGEQAGAGAGSGRPEGEGARAAEPDAGVRAEGPGEAGADSGEAQGGSRPRGGSKVKRRGRARSGEK